MTDIAHLCSRYLAESPMVRGTQRAVLTRLQREPIGAIDGPKLTSKDVIDHAKKRAADGACAATAAADIVYLSGVLSYAKPGWNMADVSDAAVREAKPLLRRLRLIGPSKRRTRRPTDEETRQIVERLRSRSPLLADIVEFQDQSARRISETCRLLWADLSEATKTIIVRDMKHPRMKEGNDKRVALPDTALEVIMRQPRTDRRIFPMQPKAVSAAYRLAVNALGFPDLRLHDMRRGCSTRLLEQGYSVPEVMLVTAHDSAGMVLTTYNALKAEDFHARTAIAKALGK